MRGTSPCRNDSSESGPCRSCRPRMQSRQCRSVHQVTYLPNASCLSFIIAPLTDYPTITAPAAAAAVASFKTTPTHFSNVQTRHLTRSPHVRPLPPPPALTSAIPHSPTSKNIQNQSRNHNRERKSSSNHLRLMNCMYITPVRPYDGAVNKVDPAALRQLSAAYTRIASGKCTL